MNNEELAELLCKSARELFVFGPERRESKAHELSDRLLEAADELEKAPPAPQVPDAYTAKLEAALRQIYRRMDTLESFDGVINEICRDALAEAPQPSEEG